MPDNVELWVRRPLAAMEALVLTRLNMGLFGGRFDRQLAVASLLLAGFAGAASGQTAAVATTTTLSASSATVTYRTSVALTASVATTQAVPITVGQVIFCNASAPHCTADLNLGTVQLRPNGTAILRLAPGTVAAHSYRAVFLGTTAALTSTSAQQTVTVSGRYATATTIASTGSPTSYTLTGTVVGLGTRTLAPTGTVQFNDTSNTANPSLGTAPLGAATLGFNEAQPAGSPITVGHAPYGVATGDFNGDGFLDVVVENYNSNSVSILLGNGDGTFQPQVTYAVGSLPERVLVADFNADGALDLVVANTGSGTVSVLLGNGDGTFQSQVTYGAGSPVGLGVMDVNHDGIPDIVASAYYNNVVTVLLGRGDGTFRSGVTYATGSTPQTLAEGDFNGDGNVDLAVGNLGGNNVGILLGNGDGTFRAQVTYAVGSQPQGVQVGDFNGDGFDDLAVTNQAAGTVSVLLGRGDGTFQTQVTYPVGVQPVGLVIADFNGDGFQDISVNNTGQASLSQGVLLGNGDGTFQPQVTFPMGNFPYGVATGDFNGDGLPDMAISNFSSNTATILLSQVTQTATATLTPVVFPGTATHPVDASYSGDQTFLASVSATTPLMGGGGATQAPSSTTLTVTPATVAPGQTVTYSVAVAGSSQTTPTPTGTVTLVNGTTMLGTITLGSNGAGTFSAPAPGAGTYSIRALYGGDTSYAASTSPPQTLTVTVIPTTTSLGISSAAISQGQTETLTATVAESGGPALSGTVTFSDQNGALGTASVTPATNGGTATLTLTTLSVGTHRILASYAGDTNYGPSTSAPQTVVVSQTAQTITFPPIPTHRVGDAPFALNATASSGLPVTYAVVSGPATVSGNTVTLTGAGTVTLQASQPGNTTYAAAPNVSQTFTVTTATGPAIVSLSPPGAAAGSPALTVTLTGTGFTAASSAQWNGITLTTTYVNATTLTAVVPSPFLASPGTRQIGVFDPVSGITSPAVPFTVVAAPTIVFSGPATVQGSGQQPALTFKLVNPFPFPLAGSLSLAFTPSASNATDDPAIQFSSGGRAITFAVPANSTVTPPVQLQTGTVAGTAVVTLTVISNGVNVTPSNVAPVTITIAPAVPLLTAVTLTRTGNTLGVVVSGFSNTREVSKASFHFTPAPGANLNTPDVTADVTSVFAGWYTTPASLPYGSTVIYTQQFTLSDTASSIGSVTVTLTNSIGTSALTAAQ